MMNIDDAPLPFVADFRRQYLHVTRQHDDIDPGIPEQFPHPAESLRFILRIDRNALEWNALPLNHPAKLLMIGNHQWNFHRQLTGTPAPEQVCETMPEFAHQNGDPHF